MLVLVELFVKSAEKTLPSAGPSQLSRVRPTTGLDQIEQICVGQLLDLLLFLMDTAALSTFSACVCVCV